MLRVLWGGIWWGWGGILGAITESSLSQNVSPTCMYLFEPSVCVSVYKQNLPRMFLY